MGNPHGNLKHGMRHTTTYSSWASMLRRARYGGEGYAGPVGVDPRWESFEYFLKDMGHRPKNTTLDRIDNEKGYVPGNCRWASKKTQAENRRTVHWVEVAGDMVSLTEAGRRLGRSTTTMHRWYRQGRSFN